MAISPVYNKQSKTQSNRETNMLLYMDGNMAGPGKYANQIALNIALLSLWKSVSLNLLILNG